MTLTEDKEYKTIRELFRCLLEHGYQASMVSIHHLIELQEEIADLCKHGLLDKEFRQERLSWFDFKVPSSLPTAKSIIVVAVPRPQTQAIFTWHERKWALVIPPTYTAYDETRNNVETLISAVLDKRGFRLARTALPLKLLAVRSGLGQYGRNNICYIPGMGSFHQLVAVYSDLPPREDRWQEKTLMESCQKCHLCRQACPTGAIPSDSLLLRAEKCITYHNEKAANIPFPDWIDQSWHNCLVGCLHCQQACPHNKQFLRWVGEKQEFSEEETALILGVKRGKMPTITMTKLICLSISDDLDILRRNLRAFLRNQASHNGRKCEPVEETK